MQITPKSQSFFSKLLKHYPVPAQHHKCSSSQHNHHHHHNNQQQTKPADHTQPFQHMHDHRKQRQIYEKPTEQKLQNMRYFKELGNSRFKQQKLDEAMYFYQKVIIYSDYTFPQKQLDVADMELLVKQANVNMAICLIKQNKWAKALSFLNEGAKEDSCEKFEKFRKLALSTKKKAYYWLIKCQIKEGNFDQVENSLQKMQNMNHLIPSKQEIDELRSEVLIAKQNYQKQSQSLSKRMFA